MLHKTLKTTTGKLRVSIPTRLDEITLEQLISMQQETDLNDLQAISILSGIPLADLQNIIRIDELHEFVLPLLTLAEEIKSLYDSDEIPKSVTFHLEDGYKTVFVMHNLSVEPAGAFMAARDIIAEEISAQVNLYGPDEWQDHFNPSLQACAQVLAHYFYCRATGKPYNEYEAEAFTGEIKKLRVCEALPIAKHFFTCYPNLSKPKISCWHRLLPFSKKGRAYKPSISLNTSTP